MATLALLLWIVIAPIFFARMSVVKAVIWATLMPYLFLPESIAINLPGLPDIDKTVSTALGLMIGYLMHRNRLGAVDRQEQTVLTMRWFGWLIFGCIFIIIAGQILSILENSEPLQYGPRYLPGLKFWDGISMLGGLVLILVPFLFAKRFLATPAAHRALLAAFVAMGLFYSFLMLIEIRLSPQLNVWVYGFHQSSFVQHIRDGYRPKVFLYHGLWVGFFMFMVSMAATALWKSLKDTKWLWAALWLFLILSISKNLGAMAIATIFLGVLILVRPRTQIKIASVVALCILVYPALRQSQLVPTQFILDAAGMMSQERSDSLKYRLDNEDEVLERVAIKPLTGWGGYGRDRKYDPISGKDLTINEGLWSQTLGLRGWIGYIGLFGLLTAPIIGLGITCRRKDVPPETVALTLICAGNLIYMIPNSTLTPIGLLMFGALAGFLQYDVAKTSIAIDTDEAPPHQMRYTRFVHRFPPVGAAASSKS